MKQRICFAVVTVLSAVLVFGGAFFYGSRLTKVLPQTLDHFCRAVVVDILDTSADDSSADRNVLFTARLLSGEWEDCLVTATQNISAYDPYETVEVRPGDRVILSYGNDGSPEDEWFFSEYLRSDYLIVLSVLFFVVLLIFGKIKGFKTALSLLFTVGALFFVFIPAVLLGRPIYLFTALLGVFLTVMTLLLVNGWTWMTLSSILGCASGIGLSAIILVVSESLIQLTGQLDEQSLYLFFLGIDLKKILYAAIVIGAIGAIMDVAVNISAALHELAVKLDRPTFHDLLASGFTIGRDILGTMTNTLVLAYAGSSLGSVLLIVYYSSFSPLLLFNKELIVSELLQIIVGSLALLLTIPATSVAAAFLFSRKRFHHERTSDESDEDDPMSDALNSLNQKDPQKQEETEVPESTHANF